MQKATPVEMRFCRTATHIPSYLQEYTIADATVLTCIPYLTRPPHSAFAHSVPLPPSTIRATTPPCGEYHPYSPHNLR